MKFERIKNLSNLEIINGIEFCYQNSNDLFKSALKLKETKSFGISISLIILSVEELIKSFSLFQLMILEKEEKEIFRDIFESNNLHKSRNKLALFFNEIYKITKSEQIVELEKKHNGEDKYLAEYLISEKIIQRSILNTEKEKNTSKNWFSHANTFKNNGLYVEYNKKWFSPKRFTEKDCLNSEKEILLLKRSISEIIEYIIRNKENLDVIIEELKEFKQKMGKDFFNNYK